MNKIEIALEKAIEVGDEDANNKIVNNFQKLIFLDYF